MSSITYRIATCAQAGRKVTTLQTIPADADAPEDDAGTIGGFSLHAGVTAQAHESQKLERLCRYIARPAISEKRLSLSPRGRVVEVEVQVERAAEALDQRHRAALRGGAFDARLIRQPARDHARHEPQQRADGFGAAGEQEAKWIRKTQHPLQHRPQAEHLLHQVTCGLGHAPRAAARAKAALLAGKRQQPFRPMDSLVVPPDIFGTPEMRFTAARRLGSDSSRVSQIQDGRWKVVADYKK